MRTGYVEVGTLLDREPEIRGGRPKIAGTGITVSRVVSLYRAGLSPEEIAMEYEHLSLAQIHAALAYFHANAAEITEDLAAAEASAERWERQGRLAPGA
jgi:uncharacterized protein (DUF433 family)